MKGGGEVIFNCRELGSDCHMTTHVKVTILIEINVCYVYYVHFIFTGKAI